MGRTCEIPGCGKTISFGNSYVRRGAAKAKGGTGRKVTGKNSRKFVPNLQRIRVVIDGTTQRLNVCTQCMREGKVQKPVKMKVHLKDLAERGIIKPKPKTPAAK